MAGHGGSSEVGVGSATGSARRGSGWAGRTGACAQPAARNMTSTLTAHVPERGSNPRRETAGRWFEPLPWRCNTRVPARLHVRCSSPRCRWTQGMQRSPPPAVHAVGPPRLNTCEWRRGSRPRLARHRNTVPKAPASPTCLGLGNSRPSRRRRGVEAGLSRSEEGIQVSAELQRSRALGARCLVAATAACQQARNRRKRSKTRGRKGSRGSRWPWSAKPCRVDGMRRLASPPLAGARPTPSPDVCRRLDWRRRRPAVGLGCPRALHLRALCCSRPI